MVAQIMAPQSLREGKAVSVPIATAGLPTDPNGHHGPAVVQDFVEAIQSLEGLPLQVVFCLCTDDEHIVDCHDALDAHISGMSCDVVRTLEERV